MSKPEEHKPEQAEEVVDRADLEDRTAEDVAAGQSDAPQSLEAQLEIALAEVEKFRDLALRSEAEMQNLRRRTERDVENAHKFGSEQFVRNLLPVVDSLEKAIEAAEATEGSDTPAIRAIIEGIGLCQKMFLDALTKQGVAIVDPVGEPFDPNLHQAMTMVENANMEPNSVVAVMAKGYTLNARLVRPAMVMVSKAPENQNKAGE